MNDETLGMHRYLSMQKREYNKNNESPEAIVGHYAYHENFPYESNLLCFNGDVRKPIFNEFSNKRAFDVGCGEGRMVRRMRSFFSEVDGADISEKMVAAARERCGDSNIYLTSGSNCGDAKADFYDFVYCTISLQHIGSYDVRRSILKDIVRILKDDGKITLQFLFAKHFPYLTTGALGVVANTLVEIMPHNCQHASYMENKFDAEKTNSGCDVVMGTNDLKAVREDLLSLFETVDFWFSDISIGRGEQRVLPETHPNSHLDDSYWGTHFIFVHCTKPRKLKPVE